METPLTAVFCTSFILLCLGTDVSGCGGHGIYGPRPEQNSVDRGHGNGEPVKLRHPYPGSMAGPYQDHFLPQDYPGSMAGTMNDPIVGQDYPGEGPRHGPIGHLTYPEGSTSSPVEHQHHPERMVGPSRGVYTENQPEHATVHLFHLRNSEYFSFTTKMDWVTANKSCAAAGAHLAIINSEDEAEILAAWIRRSSYGIGEAFVGITDEGEEGNWVTIDGEPIASAGFSRWFRDDQPDNENGNENCGSLISDNWGLNDVSCTDYISHAICEKELLIRDVFNVKLVPFNYNESYASIFQTGEGTNVDNDQKGDEQDRIEQRLTHVSSGRHVQFKEPDESILQSEEGTNVNNDHNFLDGDRPLNASDKRVFQPEENSDVSEDQERKDEDSQKREKPLTGYQRFPGFNSSYRIITEYMNWETANWTCVQEGAHLAVINSEEEAKMLAALSERTDEYAAFVFVGLHYVAEEGTWLTVLGETTAEAGFARWFPGNAKQPDEVTGNDCGSIFFFTGYYYNLPCTDLESLSICEKDEDTDSDSTHG